MTPIHLRASLALCAAAAALPATVTAQNATPSPAPAPAAAPGAAPTEAPKPPFSFFITSAGSGNGANLGGLAGADAHCQKLAEAAGSTFKTWRAYLSTQASGGQAAVNARDRIGQGPWHNTKGQVVARNLSHLHGDTLEEARVGNTVSWATALTEKGEQVKRAGDKPNEHDILTGSTPDGRAFAVPEDRTCKNYTSSAEDGAVQVGHFDRTGGNSISWNSAHPSRGCSQDKLKASGGAGLFYCFAAN